MNDNEVLPYGWMHKSSRLYGLKKSKKSKRVSVLAALLNSEIHAPFSFEGSCDRTVFELYLSKVLLPILPSGKILVLDNASFHKGGNIKILIENAGCSLLYLPPYSPDYNPIEHKWFPLKHNTRKLMEFQNLDLNDALQKVLTIGKH